MNRQPKVQDIDSSKQIRKEKLNIVCLKIIDTFIDKNLAEINFRFFVKNDIFNSSGHEAELYADLHSIDEEKYIRILSKIRTKYKSLTNIK